MLVINRNTTVRDLLQNYPEIVFVLLQHGMCPDCRTDPPPVSLGHFAEKHCDGDIQALLDEIHQKLNR
jgi:hypothetical protein